MALTALCGDDAWGTTWSRVVQHRFTGEAELAGHAVGNVLIGLTELLGDTVPGWMGGTLLGAHGRVLPMASVPLDLVAEVEGLDPSAPSRYARCAGQVACASTTGRVRSVTLIPEDPPACPQAVTAIWTPTGRPRSRLLVHQRAAAPDGPRAGRRDESAPGPADRGAEPGRAARRDGGILPGDAPGRAGRTRAATPDRHRAGRSGPRWARPPSWRRRRPGWAVGWSWTTWRCARDGTARPATAGRGVRRDFRGGVSRMAMTAAVKDELSRVAVSKRAAARPRCRRCCGSPADCTRGRRVIVEAELDTGAVARRLRKDIGEVYGHVLGRARAGPSRLAQGHQVRGPGPQDGDCAGPPDGADRQRGRPVRGLPPQIVSGTAVTPRPPGAVRSWPTAR